MPICHAIKEYITTVSDISKTVKKYLQKMQNKLCKKEGKKREEYKIGNEGMASSSSVFYIAIVRKDRL